jgi:hypothetical protein
MAGDIGIRERVLILPEGARAVSAGAALTDPKTRVAHVYGPRVVVAEVPQGGERESVGLAARAVVATDDATSISEDVRASLAPAERMGVDALALRQSYEYMAAKEERPLADELWDSGAAQTPACTDN